MRTVFRFKPSSDKENDKMTRKLILELDPESKTAIILKTRTKQEIEFTCNELFSPNATQSSLFHKVGQRSIDNALSGYNASIFAYGQTGSGKTYTMFGNLENEGLVFRCLRYLFHSLKSNCALQSYSVSLSVIEIYNNFIYDGLCKTRRQLKLISNHEICNLSSLNVDSFSDCSEILNNAIANRMTADTCMNSESSRSHLLIFLNLKQQMFGANGALLESQINLIDLAGSERVKKTGIDSMESLRFSEAKSINSSLLCLGRVVDALVSQTNKNKQYIPYRDCTLTRLLTDSLGGNAMTTMIGCCAMENGNLEETKSTLEFISRSKKIRNEPIINTKYNTKSMISMQNKFDLYKQEAEKIISMQKQQFMAVIAQLKKENIIEINDYKSKLDFHSKNLDKLRTDLEEMSECTSDVSKLGEKYRVLMFLEAVRKSNDDADGLNCIDKMLANCNNNIDIDACDTNGDGALMFAIRNQKPKILKYLLKCGANANIANNDSISALMTAVIYRDFEMCNILLKYGKHGNECKVDYRNSLGCTAIHIAASKGYADIVQFLLKYSKNVNRKSKRGWTALMFASKAGHCDIVRLLLSCNHQNDNDNIEIDCVNKANCSALILACYSGNSKVVDLLMKCGANYNIRDKFGMTAHIWAQKKGFADILHVMNRYGSKLSIRDKLQVML